MKGKKSKLNKFIWLLLGISVIMVAIVVVQFFFLKSSLSDGKVVEGTVVNGVNIAGLDENVAEAKLKEEFERKADNFKLTLTHDGKSWDITKQDFEVNTNIHSILAAAQEREQLTDSYEKQKNLITNLQKEGKSVNVAINYVFVGLDKKIDDIIKEVEIEPQDSVITFYPERKDKFEITDEKSGLRVDKATLYQNINDNFLKSNKIIIELPMVEQKASVTKEYNKTLTHCISSFSTNVADSTGNRKSNVNLALSKFDGMVVNPGDTISFNKITGPHSEENGYKVATIIYNSKFVDGVGGGICQASTTLYNALLLAGQKIDEVHKHTLPVKYVPLALDAMVSEYVSDLKWTNTTDYPIYIHTWHDESSVHCEIYSHTLPVTYKTRAEVVKKLASSGDVVQKDVKKEYTDKVLFEGEYYRISYPRDGYEAVAYLQTYEDGKLVQEEEIRHEIYQPQNGVVIEGVEKPSEGISPINDVSIISSSTHNMNNEICTVPTSVCP